MLGPLTRVGTITAGITLDVDRLLYMGKGRTMKFMVPDTTQIDNWRTVLILKKGFNRITGPEKTQGDGAEVIFKVADLKGAVRPIIGLKELHVEVENQLYSVATVPPVASNEAQVFALTCKTRTQRTKYFENKR